jgi:hypothetical protein
MVDALDIQKGAADHFGAVDTLDLSVLGEDAWEAISSTPIVNSRECLSSAIANSPKETRHRNSETQRSAPGANSGAFAAKYRSIQRNIMNTTRLVNIAIRTVYLGFAAVAAAGCGFENQDENRSEPVAEASQGWYSSDPYDQHGRMTFDALEAGANSYGIDWDCTKTITYADPLHLVYLYTTYGGNLCDGNVATDDTTSSSNHPFFISLWGTARADSNNHHFLRDGIEPLDYACGNAVADLYKGTYTALSWYSNGDKVNFQRAVGAISHAIQDSFAPAHTRRDAASNSSLLDLCTIHQSAEGACQHEYIFPLAADDADDNPALANKATTATKEYLIAVAKMATGKDPNALTPVIQKWFACPMLVWLPSVWNI